MCCWAGVSACSLGCDVRAYIIKVVKLVLAVFTVSRLGISLLGFNHTLVDLGSRLGASLSISSSLLLFVHRVQSSAGSTPKGSLAVLEARFGAVGAAMALLVRVVPLKNLALQPMDLFAEHANGPGRGSRRGNHL